MTKKIFSLLISCLTILLLINGALCQEELLEEDTKKHIIEGVEYKYLIFTTKCYDTFFKDHNFFHFECLKMVISLLNKRLQ